MHSNEGRSVLKKAIAPGSWPNWAMVIIAAVTASIAIQTLGTIKTQTKAAKDSADAAKKSADALMIGDRAWVLLEREDIQDKIQAPYLPTAEQMMVEQRMPHCVLFLKNFGKTPAKITALRFELEVSDNPNVPPSNAAYDISGTLNPYMLPQEGCLPYEARLNTQRMEDCDSIRGGVRFLWLFGIIKYTDVFERGPESLHETRFCYVWETRMNASKPFWFSRGDADYNRFT